MEDEDEFFFCRNWKMREIAELILWFLPSALIVISKASGEAERNFLIAIPSAATIHNLVTRKHCLNLIKAISCADRLPFESRTTCNDNSVARLCKEFGTAEMPLSVNMTWIRPGK
jgi:hypothetical protein